MTHTIEGAMRREDGTLHLRIDIGALAHQLETFERHFERRCADAANALVEVRCGRYEEQLASMFDELYARWTLPRNTVDDDVDATARDCEKDKLVVESHDAAITEIDSTVGVDSKSTALVDTDPKSTALVVLNSGQIYEDLDEFVVDPSLKYVTRRSSQIVMRLYSNPEVRITCKGVCGGGWLYVILIE